MTARAYGLRFSFCFALLMVGSGMQLPFLPLWLQAQGLTVPEIAAVVAAMTAMRVVGAPLFAAIADATGQRFLVIRGCAVLSLLAYWLLSQMATYQSIMWTGLLASVLFAPIFPLIEGFSVDTSSRLGIEYGRLRLWASLSFLAGSLLAGALLTMIPAQDTMLLITAAQAMTIIATFILPPEPPAPPHHLHVSALQLGPAFKFLFASRFTVFLLAASLSNSSHGMLYSVSTVHWTNLGFNTFQIGMLWAAGIVAEATLFFSSGAILRRVPLPALLCIGLSGAVIRWFAMAYVTDYSVTCMLQVLHCVSFATAHLSLMHFIRLNVPVNLRNTAQGLYTAFASGLLLSSVTWASGPLYDRYGGHAFVFTGIIALVGLAIAIFNLLKLSPRAPVVAAALNPTHS